MESNVGGLPHSGVKGYHEPLQTHCRASFVDNLGRGEKMFMSIIRSHAYGSAETHCRTSNLSVTNRQRIPLAAMFLYQPSQCLFVNLSILSLTERLVR